jgi:hypothetical protein
MDTKKLVLAVAGVVALAAVVAVVSVLALSAVGIHPAAPSSRDRVATPTLPPEPDLATLDETYGEIHNQCIEAVPNAGNDGWKCIRFHQTGTRVDGVHIDREITRD